MSNTERMDVFKGVHKGLRKALYGLSLQAGATEAGRPQEMASLRVKALEVFHFLDHHALNEDRFLIPLMESRSLAPASRLIADHAGLDGEVEKLRGSLDHLEDSPSLLHGFYLALNRFIARYLEHLNGEETDILPLLHGAFTDDELAAFPRQSVAATTPPDQAMMMAHVFPSMNASEIRDYFAGMRSKAPKEVAQRFEEIARGVLGSRAGILD